MINLTQKEKDLFLQFQERWSLERVKNMTLEEYTGIGKDRDDFTCWIENKLDKLGSIWGIGGGGSFKFGIYKRANDKEREDDSTYKYNKEYAWCKKYGETPQQVFEQIKSLIVTIIECSQQNKLDEIDEINLVDMYKWKIAFHYQNINNMRILCIFSKNILQNIAKGENLGENLSIAQIYQKLLGDKTYTLETMIDEKFMPLWEKYGLQNNKEKEKMETSNQTNTKKVLSNRQIPLNQILYGPPGTGKTYQTIDKALEILGFSKKDQQDLDYDKIKTECESLKILLNNNSQDRAYAKVLFDHFKEEGQIAFITFHQSFSYEEFVEGIKPNTDNPENMIYKIQGGIFKKLCKKAKDSNEPYILIIDEINRGNISKILGELITLIEPSKRIGENEALEVTLPYSQESFGVPNNLYIIGTMNTADRSIALLDTALRRRFEFIEMMPDCEALKNIWLVKNINNKRNEKNELRKDEYYDECDMMEAEISFKILQAINHRIEFLLDREHTIGHAFFFEKAKYYKNNEVNWWELALEDLKTIFAKKIIPLLQEYFYEDYAKIDAVLNENGMIESQTMQDLGISLSDDFIDSEKSIYRITDSSKWGIKNFQKIYDDSIKINDEN